MAEPAPTQTEVEAEIDKREAADGGLPEDLQAPPDVEGATSLTEDVAYGDDEPEPTGEQGEPSAEEGGEPKPGDEAGTAEGADKTKEQPAKAGQEPKPAGWDKERQRIDQENATLRKDNAGLREDVTDLRTRVEQIAGQKPAGDAADKTDQDLKDMVALDEFATEEDRNAAVNELIRRDKIRGERQQAHEQATTQEREQRVNKKAYDDLLAKGEATYGKEHRNEVIKRLGEFWKEQGYDEDYYPDPASTAAIVEAKFAQVATEAKSKATPNRKRKTAGPAHDTGAGGKTAPSSEQAGMQSLDDVMDEMLAKGQVRRG